MRIIVEGDERFYMDISKAKSDELKSVLEEPFFVEGGEGIPDKSVEELVIEDIKRIVERKIQNKRTSDMRRTLQESIEKPEIPYTRDNREE